MLFRVVNLLNICNRVRSALVTAGVVVVLVLIIEVDVLQKIVTTADLAAGQWLARAAVGLVILWLGELMGGRRWARAPRVGEADRRVG